MEVPDGLQDVPSVFIPPSSLSDGEYFELLEKQKFCLSSSSKYSPVKRQNMMFKVCCYWRMMTVWNLHLTLSDTNQVGTLKRQLRNHRLMREILDRAGYAMYARDCRNTKAKAITSWSCPTRCARSKESEATIRSLRALSLPLPSMPSGLQISLPDPAHPFLLLDKTIAVSYCPSLSFESLENELVHANDLL